MRYAILLIPIIALVALACDEEGQGRPTATSSATMSATQEPSPAAGTVDVRDLLLRPEEVPPELGQLGEPLVQTAQDFFADQLEAGELTGEDIAAWGVVAVAGQAYNSPEQYPAQGAQFIFVSTTLSDASSGAEELFQFHRTRSDRGYFEEFEAFPGREILEFETSGEPAIGEERLIIHYLSQASGETVRLDTYYALFRRDRVVALIQVRAPEGNVTVDHVTGLATTLDSRIQRGLQ